MKLEIILRNFAIGATYLTLSAIACNGGATPTAPSMTATPSPTAAAASPTPTLQYNAPTSTPTATATPTSQPPTATVTPSPTPTATPIASYTDEQLRQKLSGLVEILRANEPVLDANGNDYKGYVGKITDALDAGYFLFTGRTLQQDRISILPLVKKDYDAFIDKLPYTNELKADMKENFGGFAWDALNLKTGKHDYFLVIRGDFPASSVFWIGTREVEQPLTNRLDPTIRNTTIGSLALGEAREDIVSKGIYRALEEFTGKNFTNYGSNEKNIGYVMKRLSDYQKTLEQGLTFQNFSVTGIIITWATAQEMGLLKDGQHVTPKDDYALFKTMVMGDDAAQTYVDGILSRVDPSLDFIRKNALSRLIPDYPAEKEGPASIETAVLRP